MSLSRRGFLGAVAGAGVLLACDARSAEAATFTCDVAVIGGGLGGVAAALAACRNGRTVVLTEETRMLGGQLTSQLVPPDEHDWIEDSAGGYGRSASYAELRERVRASYRTWRPVTSAFSASSQPNPGAAWVSRIAAEPMVWRGRIGDMLAPYLATGQLRILWRRRPVDATVSGSTVESVVVEDPGGGRHTLVAPYFIDASELGDLLPVVGANFTVGREAGTGELLNTATVPDPEDQQAITWVAALGYKAPGDYRATVAPAGYDDHRERFDAFFSTHLFDPTRDYAYADGPNFWQYRRVIARSQFTAPVEEVSLINFPCNDYKAGAILGVSATERQQHLEGARQLTACLIHYLQCDIPRADGSGHGYPGLRLRPDVAGTIDGYAAAPYVREARRLVSVGRVWEWHVGVDARPSSSTATQFADAVATGHYSIDVHAGPKMQDGLWRPCYPYQVPFMALIPNNRSNVLAGGKAFGVSHIVNGAYRLHPTEWATGEAAGVAAHCCIAWSKTPAQVRSTQMADLRDVIEDQGGQTEWPAEIRSAS